MIPTQFRWSPDSIELDSFELPSGDFAWVVRFANAEDDEAKADRTNYVRYTVCPFARSMLIEYFEREFPMAHVWCPVEFGDDGHPYRINGGRPEPIESVSLSERAPLRCEYCARRKRTNHLCHCFGARAERGAR